MNFQLFGTEKAPTLLLIPGLGVSYEIFLPLIRLTEGSFRIIAAEVDGFTLGKHTRFTSVDDQAAQVIAYIKAHFDGHLDYAYGLSLGGTFDQCAASGKNSHKRSVLKSWKTLRQVCYAFWVKAVTRTECLVYTGVHSFIAQRGQ